MGVWLQVQKILTVGALSSIISLTSSEQSKKSRDLETRHPIEIFFKNVQDLSKDIQRYQTHPNYPGALKVEYNSYHGGIRTPESNKPNLDLFATKTSSTPHLISKEHIFRQPYMQNPTGLLSRNLNLYNEEVVRKKRESPEWIHVNGMTGIRKLDGRTRGKSDEVYLGVPDRHTGPNKESLGPPILDKALEERISKEAEEVVNHLQKKIYGAQWNGNIVAKNLELNRNPSKKIKPDPFASNVEPRAVKEPHKQEKEDPAFDCMTNSSSPYCPDILNQNRLEKILKLNSELYKELAEREKQRQRIKGLDRLCAFKSRTEPSTSEEPKPISKSEPRFQSGYKTPSNHYKCTNHCVKIFTGGKRSILGNDPTKWPYCRENITQLDFECEPKTPNLQSKFSVTDDWVRSYRCSNTDPSHICRILKLRAFEDPGKIIHNRDIQGSKYYIENEAKERIVEQEVSKILQNDKETTSGGKVVSPIRPTGIKNGKRESSFFPKPISKRRWNDLSFYKIDKTVDEIFGIPNLKLEPIVATEPPDWKMIQETSTNHLLLSGTSSTNSDSSFKCTLIKKIYPQTSHPLSTMPSRITEPNVSERILTSEHELKCSKRPCLKEHPIMVVDHLQRHIQEMQSQIKILQDRLRGFESHVPDQKHYISSNIPKGKIQDFDFESFIPVPRHQFELTTPSKMLKTTVDLKSSCEDYLTTKCKLHPITELSVEETTYGRPLDYPDPEGPTTRYPYLSTTLKTTVDLKSSCEDYVTIKHKLHPITEPNVEITTYVRPLDYPDPKENTIRYPYFQPKPWSLHSQPENVLMTIYFPREQQTTPDIRYADLPDYIFHRKRNQSVIDSETKYSEHLLDWRSGTHEEDQNGLVNFIDDDDSLTSLSLRNSEKQGVDTVRKVPESIHIPFPLKFNADPGVAKLKQLDTTENNFIRKLLVTKDGAETKMGKSRFVEEESPSLEDLNEYQHQINPTATLNAKEFIGFEKELATTVTLLDPLIRTSQVSPAKLQAHKRIKRNFDHLLKDDDSYDDESNFPNSYENLRNDELEMFQSITEFPESTSESKKTYLSGPANCSNSLLSTAIERVAKLAGLETKTPGSAQIELNPKDKLEIDIKIDPKRAVVVDLKSIPKPEILNKIKPCNKVNTDLVRLLTNKTEVPNMMKFPSYNVTQNLRKHAYKRGERITDDLAGYHRRYKYYHFNKPCGAWGNPYDRHGHHCLDGKDHDIQQEEVGGKVSRATKVLYHDIEHDINNFIRGLADDPKLDRKIRSLIRPEIICEPENSKPRLHVTQERSLLGKSNRHQNLGTAPHQVPFEERFYPIELEGDGVYVTHSSKSPLQLSSTITPANIIKLEDTHKIRREFTTGTKGDQKCKNVQNAPERVETAFKLTKIRKRNVNYSDSTGELATLKRIVSASEQAKNAKVTITRVDRPIKDLPPPAMFYQNALGNNNIKYTEPFDIQLENYPNSKELNRILDPNRPPSPKIYSPSKPIRFYHTHNINRHEKVPDFLPINQPLTRFARHGTAVLQKRRKAKVKRNVLNKMKLRTDKPDGFILESTVKTTTPIGQVKTKGLFGQYIDFLKRHKLDRVDGSTSAGNQERKVRKVTQPTLKQGMVEQALFANQKKYGTSITDNQKACIGVQKNGQASIENYKSDDDELLNQAMIGQLANNIVDSVIEKVKISKDLKNTLGSSLSRHNYIQSIASAKATIKSLEKSDDMLQQVICVLNRIVNQQVQLHTCLPLPTELQEFLRWITHSNKSAPELVEQSKPITIAAATTTKNINCSEYEQLIANVRLVLSQFEHFDPKQKQEASQVHDYLSKKLEELDATSICINQRKEPVQESVSEKSFEKHKKIGSLKSSEKFNRKLQLKLHADDSASTRTDKHTENVKNPQESNKEKHQNTIEPSQKIDTQPVVSKAFTSKTQTRSQRVTKEPWPAQISFRPQRRKRAREVGSVKYRMLMSLTERLRQKRKIISSRNKQFERYKKLLMEKSMLEEEKGTNQVIGWASSDNLLEENANKEKRSSDPRKLDSNIKFEKPTVIQIKKR